MKNIAILGSTGSIGTQALEIARMYPDKFNIVGLAAKRNANLLLKQIIEFKPVLASIEDIDEYKAAFAVCDKDHDGKISATEMGNIMRTLGKNFSDKEFNEIINKIETQGNGYVELHEFLNLMAENKTDENTLKEEQTNLIQAFSYFDRDNSGYIDYNEFKHILTTVSEKLSPKEVEKLDELCKSQIDENGKLKYRDFMQLILLR